MSEYAAKSDPDLVAEWRRVGLHVPHDLVMETLERGERLVPLLGPLLGDPRIWDADDPEGWAGPHALMLLQCIASPSAAPYVANFLSEGVGEEWLTEEGHNLVYRLGPTGMDAIWGVIENPEADEYGRAEGILGLSLIGLTKEEARPGIVERIRPMASRLAEAEDATSEDELVLTSLCYALADLHDEEARPLLSRAIVRGRCDWDQDGMASAYETPFAETFERWKNDPMEHFTAKRLHELEEMRQEEPPSSEEDGEEDRPNPYRAEPKVGRNDPCPCGSGKKFKKCCGK